MSINKGPHIPLAVGLIFAYSNKHNIFKDNYDLKEIIFLCDPISEVINRIEKPDVFAVSNYMWNQRYNNEISNKVKKIWPNCFIIYGGPNIPEWDNGFLKENPFVDIIVRKEGEITFYEILKELLNENPKFEGTEGTIIPGPNREYIINPNRGRIQDLSIIPSPYAEGYFDTLDAETKRRFGPNVGMDGALQTNRGCPYKCSFCTIGAEYYRKIRKFPIDRVKADIDWMSEHNSLFVNNCDSNFGIFPRDLEIAKYLVKKKRENGFPEKVRTDWAKSASESVLKTAKILEEGNINRGLTIAIQSVSNKVLDAIKRQDVLVDEYHELNNKYKANGICTYTELILPLPEETYDSFLDGFSSLIEKGQHNCINVYDCSILPNAEIGDLEYRKKHGFEAVMVPQIEYHLIYGALNPDDPTEFHENVIATNTMPWEDWIKTKIWIYTTIVGHFYGITHFLARFLLNYKKISIREFYERFLSWARSRNDRFSKSIGITYDLLKNIRKGDVVLNRIISDQRDLGGISWLLDEAMFIDAYIDRERFFPDLGLFIRDKLRIKDIKQDLLDEVLLFNRLYVIDHEKSYPISCRFRWNLEEYVFTEGADLSERDTHTTFESINYNGDLRKFCRERVWYARQMGGARASIGREGIKKSPIEQSAANESLDKARYKKSLSI